MELKQLMQINMKNSVFLITIVLFAFQAFSADSKNTSSSEKSQAKKPAVKQTVPAPKPNPAVSPSSFRPDMPLREAIDILRNSTIPPLNIAVLWKDLNENADITRDTPIEIDGVTGVSLKTHLSLLLMSLSSGSSAELGYIVDGNVIIVATKESLPKKNVTRVYDISDLVAPPSMGGVMGGMGMGMGMMQYGNMMPYGTYGTTGGLNQYGNTGYMNQGYMNQNRPSYGN